MRSRAQTKFGDLSKTGPRACSRFKAKLISPLAAARAISQSEVCFDHSEPTPVVHDRVCVAGNTLYTLHETASTLTQQEIPPAPNGTTGPLLANFSVIPPGLPQGAVMRAAEIQLAEASPSFPEPFIYVSNRNIGDPPLDPRGEAITIFRVEPTLEPIGFVFTGLDQIRGMELGGPENELLIASGVEGSGGTILLKRTEGGRNLEILARNTDVPTRSTFVWLN